MSAGQYETGPSLGTLLGGIIHDIAVLLRSELKLARIELDGKIRKVIVGGVFIVGGALTAFAGLIVLLLGVAAILALFLPVWAALLIVGAVIVVGAALLARAGISMLSLKRLAPERTWSNLQKDALLIKEHV